MQRFITQILQKAGLTQSLETLLDSIPTPPPQGWERIKLGQVASVQSGGTPSREVAEYWNGDVNWIKSEVCQNCYVYESQVKEKITELGLKKSSAKIFKKDSVLIALVGATIGKVGYLTFDSTTNQNIAGIYPLNRENLHTKFLYFACLGLYRFFVEKGGFTMANLTFIKNLKIPIPPIEAQEKIINAIENIESKISLLESNLSLLETIKIKVLQSYLQS
ncbi:restriction endonuclease subunit S [uncultured Helicobacter sp.]|uniref:restriction endonuclease subunit S n=1 Tax=uncultured Helicobacter sp. TaxID=175537 RepID=UPI0026172E94|nr:restriction endonuclease subunit S [uncultured Helicobacter sp.]